MSVSLINRKNDGGVAILEMNDPPANTYTYEMMQQLDKAILDCRMDEKIFVIVLTGYGEKFFSAGANIKMLSEVDPTFKYYFCLHANEMLLRLEHTPKLVIAALNDHCVGGGLEIAMAADIRIARKDAGIDSLSQLSGKRLATPQMGNTQDLSAKHYVMAELKQKDVNNVLPIANTEQGTLMARKEIDAAWAPEPWGSRLIIEGQAKLLALEKDLWPNKQFSLTLVVTTPQYLQKHPDIVERILIVHLRMTRWLNAQPQNWATPLDQALKQLTGKALPAGVVSSSMNYVQFSEEPLEETLSTMNQWAYELKLTNNPALGPGLVDTTILRKVQAQSPTTQPQTVDH